MDEQRYAALQAETASVERRILQFGLGTLLTLAGLGLGEHMYVPLNTDVCTH